MGKNKVITESIESVLKGLDKGTLNSFGRAYKKGFSSLDDLGEEGLSAIKSDFAAFGNKDAKGFIDHTIKQRSAMMADLKQNNPVAYYMEKGKTKEEAIGIVKNNPEAVRLRQARSNNKPYTNDQLNDQYRSRYKDLVSTSKTTSKIADDAEAAVKADTKQSFIDSINEFKHANNQYKNITTEDQWNRAVDQTYEETLAGRKNFSNPYESTKGYFNRMSPEQRSAAVYKRLKGISADDAAEAAMKGDKYSASAGRARSQANELWDETEKSLKASNTPKNVNDVMTKKGGISKSKYEFIRDKNMDSYDYDNINKMYTDKEKFNEHLSGLTGDTAEAIGQMSPEKQRAALAAALHKRASTATMMDNVSYHKIPQMAAGIGTTAWLVSRLDSSKGQMSNTQLYGQQQY